MKTAIVSIINEKYSHPFCVMLTSLIQNNQNLECDYVVMYDGNLEEKTITNINNVYSKIKLIKIKNEFNKYYDLVTYRTDQWKLEDFSALSRFEIFNLNEYDKLIYFDVDIIINNPIDYLLNDCNDQECYAVKKENNNGFNAGIMVINNNNKFDEYKKRCVDFLNLKKEVRGNQDAFNQCFAKTTSFIPNRFNLTTMYTETSVELKDNTAIILHYPGCNKPWDKRNKFSPYYSSCDNWIKDKFLEKWNFYENIFKQKKL